MASRSTSPTRKSIPGCEKIAEAAADLEDAAVRQHEAPDEALDLFGVVMVLLDPARAPLGDGVVDRDARAPPLELPLLELGELCLVLAPSLLDHLLRAHHADPSS
jgi:hypothetical protein